MLERVAVSSSRGSSRPKDQTRVSCVSCTSRWILYHWHHLSYFSKAAAVNHCKPEIYSPPVRKPEVRNQGVRRASLPLKSLGRGNERTLPVSSASGGSRQPPLWLHASSLCVCVFSPLMRTPPIGSGPTLLQQKLVFTHHLYRDPRFHITSHSEVPGRHEFCKNAVQPSTYI